MIPKAGEDRSALYTSGRYVFLCFFISLTLPNIVFSGDFWFQTLHPMKWVFATVPIAILCIVAAARLFKWGPERLCFSLDPFGALWLALFLLVSLQPLFLTIKSPPTFVREWFSFSALWAAYVLFYRSFRNEYLMPILWGASVNAALNVVFAELQLAGLNAPFSFILPTPGHYIGNTGQQNMFALWVACGLLGGIYIFLKLSSLAGEISKRRRRLVSGANLLLFLVNSWGLWASTSRSGLLAFASGSLALLVLTKRQLGRKSFLCAALCCALFLFMFAPVRFVDEERGELLASKISDVGLAGRKSIWATSLTMFSQRPFLGVGLGHFKWNYLEAQRSMFERFPDMEWKYTLWAHNEVLQWFCETGFIGGAFLIGMAVWWLRALYRSMADRGKISLEALWAVGMLFLFWMDAQWTRPFHRIENALWMSLAFALANRELLPRSAPRASANRPGFFRLFGLAAAVVAAFGLFFLADGLVGDRALALADETKDLKLQRQYLERALDSFMVRDLAERQLAYHFIDVANASQSDEDAKKAIDALRRYFEREPQSKDLMKLMELYGRASHVEGLKEMARYLRPGLYKIEL